MIISIESVEPVVGNLYLIERRNFEHVVLVQMFLPRQRYGMCVRIYHNPDNHSDILYTFLVGQGLDAMYNSHNVFYLIKT